MTHKIVVFIVVMCFLSAFCESPCPEYFEYVQDGNAVYGMIRLKSDGQQLSSLLVRANFTIAAQLPSSYIGRLEPVGDDLLLLNYNAGQTISFRVHFPTTSPLPKLTALTANERFICGGPPDTLIPGSYVTTISLQSLLYLKTSGVPTGNYPNFISQPMDNNKVIITFNTNKKGSLKPETVDYMYYNIPADSTLSNHPQIILENPSYPNTFHVDSFPQKPINTFQNTPEQPSQNPWEQNTQQQNNPSNQKFPPKYPSQNYPDQNPPKYPVQQKPVQTYPTVQPTDPPKTGRPVTKPTTVPSTTKEIDFKLDERFPSLSPTTSRPEQNAQSNEKCGVTSTGNEKIPLIYKGDSFTKGDWPWLVAIYKRKDAGLNFVCSGTLISDRHIITAAHCMQTKVSYTNLRDMVIKVGVYNLNEWGDDGTVTRTLTSAVIHESYNASTLAHDILVAMFEKRVQFSDTIRPACLWSGSSDISHIVGSSGIVAGWGASESSSPGHGAARVVAMPVVSTAKCRASRPDFHHLTSAYTLCAGDRNGAGPCLGDSGGGLYMMEAGRWRIRGIVSLSLRSESNSCNLNEYVVFTDAAQYLAWISYVMNT